MKICFKLQLSSYESFKVHQIYIFISENLLRLVQRFWPPFLLGWSDRDETSWGLPPDMYLGPNMKKYCWAPIRVGNRLVSEFADTSVLFFKFFGDDGRQFVNFHRTTKYRIYSETRQTGLHSGHDC